MTPMTQAVNDWLNAQYQAQRLTMQSHAVRRQGFVSWAKDCAEAALNKQRECRRCGMTLVALYPAANDEAGQGPAQA